MTTRIFIFFISILCLYVPLSAPTGIQSIKNPWYIYELTKSPQFVAAEKSKKELTLCDLYTECSLDNNQGIFLGLPRTIIFETFVNLQEGPTYKEKLDQAKKSFTEACAKLQEMENDKDKKEIFASALIKFENAINSEHYRPHSPVKPLFEWRPFITIPRIKLF